MSIWTFYVATDEFLTTGILKSLKVIWTTKLSSFFYLFMLGFFTILIRLWTWNSSWIKEQDAPFYTTSKWTTWYNALHSWWLITLEDVFPDCTYLFYENSIFLWLVVWWVYLFSKIVVLSVLTGVYANGFQDLHVADMNEIISSDPNYRKLLDYVVSNPNMNKDWILLKYNEYKIHGIEYVLNAPADWKELGNEDSTSVVGSDSDSMAVAEQQGLRMEDFYNSLIVTAAITMVDVYIMLTPFIK
jgi:hypothetical protein